MANKLRRDIQIGDILVMEDGSIFSANSGNGMKTVNMGRSIFAYPYDNVKQERVGDLMRIDADIDPHLTKEYNDAFDLEFGENGNRAKAHKYAMATIGH
jgi:hypothetical protein